MSWLKCFGLAILIVLGFPLVLALAAAVLQGLEKIFGREVVAIILLICLVAAAIHVLC